MIVIIVIIVMIEIVNVVVTDEIVVVDNDCDGEVG